MLSLISALLSLVHVFMKWANDRHLLQAGADAEIARQLAEIMRMTEQGKAIFEKIEGMSDPELDEWLKELGRD